MGAEYDNRPEALLAAMGTAPAEVIVCDTIAGGIPDFHLPQEKDHSSRRFLLILGMGALLSAVSAGVAVSAVILYHLGIIFGFFLPYKPVKNPLVFADRVRGSPLVLYRFGYILGRFLSFLFLPFHRLALPV